MALEYKSFFTDPIFKISKQDRDILSRSYFSHHAGKYKGWYADDVLNTLKADPSMWNALIDNGYVKDGEIDWPLYDINELGFRSPDWHSGKKGAIFLGCSDMFGIGNYIEHTCSQIVSGNLNVVNYNLAVPGGGLDQAYRVLKYHIKDINADYVFLLIPEPSRREIFTDIQSVLLSPSSFDYHHTTKLQLGDYFDYKKLEEVFFGLLCDEKYLLMETNKSLDAIQHLCNENNKKLITVKNPVYFTNKKSFEIKKEAAKGILGERKDLACDLVHMGKKFQKIIANLFMEKL